MRQVLCIKKPYFHFASGEKYGPVYNEVCNVLEIIHWDAYPDQVYYRLEGYDQPRKGFAFPFPVFRAVYFVDMISDAKLEEALEEIALPII